MVARFAAKRFSKLLRREREALKKMKYEKAVEGAFVVVQELFSQEDDRKQLGSLHKRGPERTGHPRLPLLSSL